MAFDYERITTVSLSVAHRDKLEWLQARRDLFPAEPSLRGTIEYCIDQAVLAIGHDPKSLQRLENAVEGLGYDPATLEKTKEARR